MEYHYRSKFTWARHYLSYLSQLSGNCGQTGLGRTPWQIWWCTLVQNFKFWVKWMSKFVKPVLDRWICHWQWWVLMNLVCLEVTESEVSNLTRHKSVDWMPSQLKLCYSDIPKCFKENWTRPWKHCCKIFLWWWFILWHSHHRKIGWRTPGNTGGVSSSRRIRPQIKKEQVFADGTLCDLPGSQNKDARYPSPDRESLSSKKAPEPKSVTELKVYLWVIELLWKIHAQSCPHDNSALPSVRCLHIVAMDIPKAKCFWGFQGASYC